MERRPRTPAQWTTRGTTLILLCAFALALFSGALLHSQPAQAAARSTFYGVSQNALVSTSTATSTTSTAPTATDTPAATATTAPTTTATTAPTATATFAATDTPTVVATDTPTATPVGTATPSPTATPKPTPVYTGAAPTLLDISSAVATVGQQSAGNWCGIATVALIANYLGIPIAQTDVANMISDPSSTSEWGGPTPRYISSWGQWIPGVTADIAYDFGTDPRSIAEGLTLATGWQYHAKVDTYGARDATYHIIWDLMNTRQPISVFVDHGQHSVVVYGVQASGDPMTNPGSIQYIYVWDPGSQTQSGIQSSPRMKIPINTWLSGFTDNGASDYFKYPYSSNVLGGIPLDPDPSVGPYTYIPSKYNHLWVGHYVWVSAWGGPGLNADWELNQGGALIAGAPGSGFPTTPEGYTGPVVGMPTNPPPPPPPVQVFTYKPLPKPQPKPRPTPTPRPTATPRPTPRRRGSPTPDLGWTPQPTPSVAPAEQLACASSICETNMLPPGWITLLVALLGALMLSGVLLYPRRARLARGAVALEATALPMPPDMPEAPATPEATDAPPLGPVIVPVLTAKEPTKVVEAGESESPTERAEE